MAADHGQLIPYRVLAPSGVVALNIGGSTIHSGLFIPTGEYFTVPHFSNYTPMESTGDFGAVGVYFATFFLSSPPQPTLAPSQKMKIGL